MSLSAGWAATLALNFGGVARALAVRATVFTFIVDRARAARMCALPLFIISHIICPPSNLNATLILPAAALELHAVFIRQKRSVRPKGRK